MAKPIIDDKTWAILEPLVPVKPRRARYPGRKRLDNRAVLTGILFVLRTGISWERLPAEMGCGSGMSCWRRLQEWQADGTWARIHAMLIQKLTDAKAIDWNRASVDSTSVRAASGGRRPAPIPRIEARRGRSTI